MILDTQHVGMPTHLNLQQPPRLPIDSRFVILGQEVTLESYTLAIVKTMHAFTILASNGERDRLSRGINRLFVSAQPFYAYIDENAHLLSEHDLALAYNLVVILGDLGIYHAKAR